MGGVLCPSGNSPHNGVSRALSGHLLCAAWGQVLTPMGGDGSPRALWSFGLTGSLPRGLHLAGPLS